MQNNEIFHVIGTDLLDYSFKVEQAIKEGWTFSVDNQYAPRAWPHMFEAFMVRANAVDNLTVKIEVDATEVKKVIDDAIEQVAANATFVAEKTTKQPRRNARK